MSGKMNLRDKLEDDTLDLSLMNLEQVPVKEISTIKRFSHLDLSNNVLTTLPKNFATLTQIVKLDLSNNMLTDLPDNFGELRNLKHLDLYSNQISRLPLSIGELKNLKWLDLKQNPLTPAVERVAGPCSNSAECQACARNIVDYLSKAKTSIQEEKQRRIESLPEDTKKSPKVKRGRKKKSVERKNSDKAKVESTDEEKVENNKSPEQKTSSRNSSMSLDSQGGFFSSLCQVFISLILWGIFCCLLTATVIVVFPLFDEKRSDETFKYIHTHTGIPIKAYRHKAILLADAFVNNMKAYTNHAREIVEKFYKEYFKSSSGSHSMKS